MSPPPKRVLDSGTMLADAVKQRARELGFDLAGIAPAGPSQHRQYLRQWLDGGLAGSMQPWLERRFEERTDPAAYLPGARSIICVAMNYRPPAPAAAGTPPHTGRIARYALGQDYHRVMGDRLHALADWLRSVCPGVHTRCAVDTAPVMEKELAARAGIGWMGKNTCIINPRLGSWLVLGEVVTTAAISPDRPIADRCGTCTRCMEACPTGALTAPYRLDARRCIAYLTIEHRGDIPEDLRRLVPPWLFGCDVCQEVCPWNSRAPAAADAALAPRLPVEGIDVREVLGWTEQDRRIRLRRSAMRRATLPMLKRTAAIIAEACDTD